MITITLEADDVLAALRRIEASGARLRPALAEIGEDLIESTKQRFASGTAPDDSSWAENQPSTIARKGHAKPLIGESRSLSTLIVKQFAGQNTLLVGSNMEYAAVQQFGAGKGQFGRTRRGAPIPWGDIPPRPFIGLSDQDREKALTVLEDHLLRAIGA